MDKFSALLFIPDDGVQGKKQPLMFSPVLFRPILSRIGDELVRIGVLDICVICNKTYEEAALKLLPEALSITFLDKDDEDAVDNILGFIGAHGHTRVIVITRPVLVLKEGMGRLTGLCPEKKFPTMYGIRAESGIYIAESGVLKDAVMKASSFGAAISRAGGAYSTSEGGILPIENFTALHNVQEFYRAEIINEHIKNGVYILDKNNCYIDDGVKIESGAVIMPGTIIKGDSTIGEDCVIGPNSMIDSCTIGDRTKVNASQLTGSTIGSDTNVGPFAYVRPGCTVGDHVKVGDFVELKKAVIGNETKISHLTYVGDAELGSGVNLGCGTVTVNYDGNSKYKTIIEDNAFIGCNTNLVAPVKIGEGAYTAAGSTITQDVPGNSLAIARSRQSIKANWAKKIR